jgi:ankyrin repeat protein
VFVDQVTNGDCTALHLTSQKGRLDIVRLLIEHNTSVDQVTNSGWTALDLTWQIDIVWLLDQ